MTTQDHTRRITRIALCMLTSFVIATKHTHTVGIPQLDPNFNANGEFPGGPGSLVFDLVLSLISPLSFLVQDSVTDSDGNSYLVGGAAIEGPSPASRAFALKASKMGVIEFLTVLPQVGDGTLTSELARGVALNTSGALFLCGASIEALPAAISIIAARIEPDGTISWTQEYPSIGPDPQESASNCDVNASGALIIAALTQDSNPDAASSLFVLTVDSTDGLLVTSAPITALGPLFNSTIGGTDFLIDGDQNYIFGATKALSGTLGGPLAFAATKINPSGNIAIWTAISEPINASAPSNLLQRIAVDTNGNVILAGIEEGNGGINKFATQKLNSSGVSLWATALQDPFGTGTSDLLKDVVVNTLTNSIALAGSTNAPGFTRFATVLLDPSGSLVWTSVLPPFVTGQDDQGQTITFSTSPSAPLGCFFLAGNADITDDLGDLLGTAQLNTSGTILGQQSHSLTAVVDVQGLGFNTDVATDNTNALVTPALLLGEGGNITLVIAQFSPTGSLNWTTIIENAEVQITPTYGPRIIIDPSNFSVTAFEQVGGATNNFAAARVSETGSLIWSMVYPDLFGTGLPSAATDVDTCSDSNYVLGGFFVNQVTPEEQSFAAAKVTATGGTVLWKTGIIAPFGSSVLDIATTVNVDDAGNVYLAGSTEGMLDPVWAALCLSPSGQMLDWTAILPVTGTIFDSTLNNGELLVGGGEGIAGNFTPLIARLNAINGSLLSLVSVPLPGGMSNAAVAGLTTDTEQNIYALVSSDQASTVLKLTNGLAPIWTIALPIAPSTINQVAGVDLDSQENVIAGIPRFSPPLTLQSTLSKIHQVLLPLNPDLAFPFVPLAAV